ncbi:SusC/RagA family TonB-linked outer membrane protein [Pedobacter sp. ASV28]|uniref:SusC/RagA family TonB-linked outer membrane protein n=1 Tax=Pedobacter sp. ASV28 TaxID=2795123 RepID=UPI001E360496|nr:SusC/RagA family TonB-linked outer membrane protein [Pedobacter sp. ASV28]
MKLIGVFIFAAILQVSASTYAQNIHLTVKEATLEDVLIKLQEQSGYDFLYSSVLLKKSSPITFSVKSATIAQAMDKLLANQPLSYVINGKTVTIKSKALQDIPIKGIVTDENGQGIEGVSIKIKGAAGGVMSGNDGAYTIKVPNVKTVLSFSFLGFISQEVVVGTKTTINVVLKEQKEELTEVVVTALGIKREEKALGYAVTQIKGEQLTESLSNNWTDALSGKVAGLNLVRSGAGPTGTNKIVLRGENNLTGDNDALIVVDGVVINNSSGRTTGTGNAAYLGEDSPVDFGNGLSDINPDDIETISVLKGPGAAALYGQRGANGAIIITTKSGKPRIKGIGVTLNSNAALEAISRWPDYQYEYGSGTEGAKHFSWGTTADGASTRSSSVAWGPKFDGQAFFQYDPVTHKGATERTPWISYPNNRKDFFEVGKTFTNSVTLDGGTARTSVRFSLTNVGNDWIIPNTGYDRNTVALSASQKITDKLLIAAKINYTNKKSDNLPATGYNNQTIMYWNIMQVPNGNLDWLKEYWMPGLEGLDQSYPFSTSPDNPYLIVNEMLNKLNRNTVTGNIQAAYQFTKDLSLMVRTSMDLSYENRSEQRPMDTQKFTYGMFRKMSVFAQEMNSDFLLKYDKKLNEKVNISISGGGSRLQNRYNKDELRANSLQYPQVFTLANSRDALIALPYQSEYKINSFYGLATVSYNSYLFLDVTARNDWNSVLATPNSTDNVSFFYPSVNLSAVVSDMFKLPSYFSFAKLRASYAGVGSGGTNTYQNTYAYLMASNYPGGLLNPVTLPNGGLKPQYTTSYELGADVRLFKNRLGLDVAVYKGNTKDQILTATLDRGSGYSNIVVNGGLVSNRGIEVQANGALLQHKRGLNWKVFATFAANENKVERLTDSLFALQLQNTLSGRGSIEARIGGNISAIYGPGYKRSPDGQVIYQDGYPVLTTEPIFLGNSNAKWKASIGNEFRYKQFRLNILIDGQYGGSAYSLTHALLAEHGKLKNTLPGRYNGIIGNGVIENGDGSYRPNDVIAKDIWTYYTRHYGRENLEGSMFSTNFIKLREMRLDYTFTQKLNKSLGLQRATIGLYGRDLFMITAWPIFDPEFGTLNNGSIDKGFEIAQFPSTRTFGVNLTVGF